MLWLPQEQWNQPYYLHGQFPPLQQIDRFGFCPKRNCSEMQ
jgi:hypothetical protein